MKIEALSDNRISVELTQQDMTELDITYEEMDYSNIETRRVIWTLLDRARETLGRDIDPCGRMLIEAVPKPEGGCTINFTVLSGELRSTSYPGKLHFKKDSAYITFEFDSIDSLMSCAKSFTLSGRHMSNSELYSCEGLYRLLICPGAEPKTVKNFFSEYGSMCGEGNLQAEFTREHWELITEINAIEKLSH
ncbi:MAG: adaptor protein MecA [Clostridiales bacterium]|nr:adaptor protein MecA [Clostridiales bacterium]